MIKIIDIEELQERFSEHAKLSDIKSYLLCITPFKCPKCDGKGEITKEYNKYPSGLPDSGFVYEPGYKQIKCELCDGLGYTRKKFIPKMIQDGYEEEN